MNNKIIINFKNIVSELKTKKLRLCFLINRGLFLIDRCNNLYQMELYRVGSYLDNLIKHGITVEFNYIDSKNINDSEKEIWSISDVENFIKNI